MVEHLQVYSVGGYDVGGLWFEVREVSKVRGHLKPQRLHNSQRPIIAETFQPIVHRRYYHT